MTAHPSIEDELDDLTKSLSAESPLDLKLAKLADSLARADELFKLALTTGGATELRVTVAATLRSVLAFLTSMEIQSNTLMRLCGALYELEQGHTPTMMHPSSPDRGRPTDTVAMSGLKSGAAAAMHLLMNDGFGESKGNAGRIVVRWLQQTRFRTYGGKAISTRMVAGWRDRCIGHTSAQDAFMAKMFDLQIQIAKDHEQSPRRQAAYVIAGLMANAEGSLPAEST